MKNVRVYSALFLAVLACKLGALNSTVTEDTHVTSVISVTKGTKAPKRSKAPKLSNKDKDTKLSNSKEKATKAPMMSGITEYDVLCELYEATHGYLGGSNCKSTIPASTYCSGTGAWSPITCDASYHVTGISYTAASLLEIGVGTLPSSIGFLSNLASLVLKSYNFMKGVLPSSLGLLSKLTLLDIGEMIFTGTIPSQLCDLTLTKLSVTIDSSLTCYPGCFSMLSYFNNNGVPVCVKGKVTKAPKIPKKSLSSTNSA